MSAPKLSRKPSMMRQRSLGPNTADKTSPLGRRTALLMLALGTAMASFSAFDRTYGTPVSALILGATAAENHGTIHNIWQWDDQKAPFRGQGFRVHNSETAEWTDYAEPAQGQIDLRMATFGRVMDVDTGGRHVAIKPAAEFGKQGIEYVQVSVRGGAQYFRPVRLVHRRSETPADAPAANVGRPLGRPLGQALAAAPAEGAWSGDDAAGFVYGQAALGSGMASSSTDGSALAATGEALATVFNRMGLDDDQPTDYSAGDWEKALHEAMHRAILADPAHGEDIVQEYSRAQMEIHQIIRDSGY